MAIIGSGNNINLAPFIKMNNVEATIENLTVNGYITGTGNNVMISGIIVNGYNIKNCTNNATITANISSVGIGYIAGIGGGKNISNCVNNGYIYCNIEQGGRISAGGITSGVEDISNCINNGNIYCNAFGIPNPYSGIGGIIGEVAGYDVIVEKCLNNGSIIGNVNSGGIIGGNYSRSPNVKISYCINSGFIKAGMTAGGIMGKNTNANLTINNCINTGVIEAPDTNNIFPLAPP